MIMMYRTSRTSEASKSGSTNMANHMVVEVEVSTQLLPTSTSRLSFSLPTFTTYCQRHSAIFIAVFHMNTFQAGSLP
jgi:hypothetical protein